MYGNNAVLPPEGPAFRPSLFSALPPLELYITSLLSPPPSLLPSLLPSSPPPPPPLSTVSLPYTVLLPPPFLFPEGGSVDAHHMAGSTTSTTTPDQHSGKSHVGKLPLPLLLRLSPSICLPLSPPALSPGYESVSTSGNGPRAPATPSPTPGSSGEPDSVPNHVMPGPVHRLPSTQVSGH